MVDLSGIGSSMGTEGVAGAAAGAQKAKEEQEKESKIAAEKGLGLKDIPTTPAPKILDTKEVAETGEVEEAADQILDKIDVELSDLQEMIKNVLAKKIKLADKNTEKRHELLISAYDDCKNAYTKIQEVRRTLS